MVVKLPKGQHRFPAGACQLSHAPRSPFHIVVPPDLATLSCNSPVDMLGRRPHGLSAVSHSFDTASEAQKLHDSDQLIIETDVYRPNVGMCVVNKQGLVFAARRMDDPDTWQLPQGGIDEGEVPVEAALRELAEETSIRSVEVVGCVSRWLKYSSETLVKTKTKGVMLRYPGQSQKWYLLKFVGRDGEINLNTCHKEFSEWRWLPLDQVANNVVYFKRSVYRQMAAEFQPLIQQLVVKGTIGFGPVTQCTPPRRKAKRV